jgi:G3E family GTPase
VVDRIPALIVSGFLGSGKTSLVRHLLADARRRGVRVAVVSNELGQLGIDAELFERAGEDYVELAGGCVCCKLSDALVDTLAELCRRARPDRLIVETSGVALPFDTQLQLWRDPLPTWIGDDLAVVVVNAEQLHGERDLDDTFAQQVSSADLLLLNQTDRVPAAALPGLEARLRELEPDAPILRAQHGRVDPAVLFPPDPSGARPCRRDAAQPHVHTHDAFATEVLRFPEGVDPDEVVRQVHALAAVRAKGFVDTRDGLQLLQVVGPRIEWAPVASRPSDALLGRVVAIRRTHRG